MSELINSVDNRATARRKLLTSVSALTLAANLSSTGMAKAEDSNPLIWIELGGQMDKVGGQGEAFAPPFLSANLASAVIWNGATPLDAQKSPKFAFGEDGKISFQPENSDWVFSAGVQIGRSGNDRRVHHQTYNLFYIAYINGAPAEANPHGIDAFADTQASRSETYGILDFQAGKDVGLGLFGNGSKSTVSVGVRIAQFTSQQSFAIRARPEMNFYDVNVYKYHFHLPYFHTYHATGHAERSFHGVGPSLSWNGSAPFVGNQQDGELAVDWDVNAALLFGRQRAYVRHLETAHYVKPFWALGSGGGYITAYPPHQGGHGNARSLTVPNIGGSARLSWRVQDFKISMGYRADFFFGAIDGGIDTRKSETLGFYGPFASISIGIGG
jgi:hypothetical protein